jgi:hypothetical protein
MLCNQTEALHSLIADQDLIESIAVKYPCIKMIRSYRTSIINCESGRDNIHK